MKRSYREEGALLINKLFPEYDFDANIYEGPEEFNTSDYSMEDGLLMIRVSGSNDPTVRNPDRIVQKPEEVISFMKRWEEEDVGRFIVQRYPPKDSIKYSASGVLDYNSTIPCVSIDIRKVTKKFIELNMNTDTRDKTSRDFPILVSLKYNFFEAPPKVTPEDFPTEKLKKPINELWDFSKRLDKYFTKEYDTSNVRPAFLTTVLENGEIFPVDLKKKYNTEKHKRSANNSSGS